MDTFQLTIELGNDDVQTYADLARLLKKLAKQLAEHELNVTDSGTMRDANGNTVARWEVD